MSTLTVIVGGCGPVVPRSCPAIAGSCVPLLLGGCPEALAIANAAANAAPAVVPHDVALEESCAPMDERSRLRFEMPDWNADAISFAEVVISSFMPAVASVTRF